MKLTVRLGGRQMSQSTDAWEAFGIRIGPFGIDINSPGHAITHTRTETSHLLSRLCLHVCTTAP